MTRDMKTVVLKVADQIKEYGMVDTDEVAYMAAGELGLLSQLRPGECKRPPKWFSLEVASLIEAEW